MDVKTSLWFLEPQALYKTVKPYTLDYFPADGTFPQTNLLVREVKDVNIEDLRGGNLVEDFARTGFCTIEVKSDISIAEAQRPKSIDHAYFRQLEHGLKQKFGCDEVRILSHYFAQRHETFPVYTGKAYEYGQPVRIAHVDETPESAIRHIKRDLADCIGEIQNSEFALLNTWKPLRGPVKDWPLAFCDVSSIKDGDLEPCDQVTNSTFRVEDCPENFQVYHNSCHKWYYLSDQTTDEVVVWRQYDSRVGLGGLGVPHASFANPYAGPDELPRQSIQTQVCIWWKR